MPTCTLSWAVCENALNSSSVTAAQLAPCSRALAGSLHLRDLGHTWVTLLSHRKLSGPCNLPPCMMLHMRLGHDFCPCCVAGHSEACRGNTFDSTCTSRAWPPSGLATWCAQHRCWRGQEDRSAPQRYCLFAMHCIDCLMSGTLTQLRLKITGTSLSELLHWRLPVSTACWHCQHKQIQRNF